MKSFKQSQAAYGDQLSHPLEYYQIHSDEFFWSIRSIQNDKKSELYIFSMLHPNKSSQSRLGPYMT